MTAPADDPELLARARTGDRTAFDALVAPHLPRLRSFLHRPVAHPDDAEDLAQDAMLQAFRKLAGFRGDPAFSTWLFTIHRPPRRPAQFGLNRRPYPPGGLSSLSGIAPSSRNIGPGTGRASSSPASTGTNSKPQRS